MAGWNPGVTEAWVKANYTFQLEKLADNTIFKYKRNLRQQSY